MSLKYVQKTLLEGTFCALQVFLCAVRLTTCVRAQLRGNIGRGLLLFSPVT